MILSKSNVVLMTYVILHLGDKPCENSVLRQVSSLLRSLPAAESEKFNENFLMEYNDKLLMSYLAMITNCTRYVLDTLFHLTI
jgi:COP9 signalosome complex subunit 6